MKSMIAYLENMLPGNAVKVWLMPPDKTRKIRVLRKEADVFSGFDDPDAFLVREFSYSGTKVLVDYINLPNHVPAFYKVYYFIDGSWQEGNSKSIAPEAVFEDCIVDPLVIVRDRLEMGLKVMVERGVLSHPIGFIPVFTASPFIDQVKLPIVTVHMDGDAPDIRFLGEVTGSAIESLEYRETEGGLSKTKLSIIGWSENGDERISLRDAIKTLLIANLPIFEEAGLLLPDWDFRDQEDFETYASPIYQTVCTFSCFAPSAVENAEDTGVIKDIIVTQVM
jgi:hypothetical protein